MFNEPDNWYIFTDDQRPFRYPTNVIVTYTTLEKLKQRFEHLLGTEISLHHGYKFCDLRPMYGIVFEDVLQNYDFWGYCDVDLIWGDMRKFLPEKLLAGNNKVFSYGHCTLIRNAQEVNSFFKLPSRGVAPWAKVVKSECFFQYDEANQANGIFRQHFHNTFFEGCEGFDTDFNSRKLTMVGYKCRDKGLPLNTTYIFRCGDGRVVAYWVNKEKKLNSREFMYLHLQKRKMNNLLLGNSGGEFPIYCCE